MRCICWLHSAPTSFCIHRTRTGVEHQHHVTKPSPVLAQSDDTCHLSPLFEKEKLRSNLKLAVG